MRPEPDGESGSAVVEFALLLPILLLVLLAVVQVGVLANDRLLLVQAARAGAREAAIQGSEEPVRDAVTASAVGLDPARMQLEVGRTGSRGAPVTVTVSYEAPLAGVLAGWLMPATVTLSASATARQEFA